MLASARRRVSVLTSMTAGGSNHTVPDSPSNNKKLSTTPVWFQCRIPNKEYWYLGFDHHGRVVNCFDVVIPGSVIQKIKKEYFEEEEEESNNNNTSSGDRAQVEIPHGLNEGINLLIEIPMQDGAMRAKIDSHQDYESLSYNQLSALCAQRGLRAFAANKHILAKRLEVNDKGRVRRDSKDSDTFKGEHGNVLDAPPRLIKTVLPSSHLDLAELGSEFLLPATYENEISTKGLASMCSRYDIYHVGYTRHKMAKALASAKMHVDNEFAYLVDMYKHNKVISLTPYQHFEMDNENYDRAIQFLDSDFTLIDKDGSGTIDENELTVALQQAFGDSSAHHRIDFSPESCRLLIIMFDETSQGVIDQYSYSGIQHKIEAWKKDFDSYDTDKNGMIQYGELESLCIVAGYHFSTGFYPLLAKTYDPTGSAALNFDRLVTLFAHFTICHDAWGKQLESLQGVHEEEILLNGKDEAEENASIIATVAALGNNHTTPVISNSSSSSNNNNNSTSGAVAAVLRKASGNTSIHGSVSSSSANTNNNNNNPHTAEKITSSILRKLSRHSSSAHKKEEKQPPKHVITKEVFQDTCKKLKVHLGTIDRAWLVFDPENTGTALFTFEEFVYAVCIAK